MTPAPNAISNGQILLQNRGALREIILNRPEALNALSLEMIAGIGEVLSLGERDADAGYILVRGAGSRGLCAGGDIRRIYESFENGDDWPARMWPTEYAQNAYIAKYPKPYIAIMDGIVMGGGIGVAAHGSHRIVTERTKAASPEVMIGLIPDVGQTWLLSRAPGEIGTCLALTGMTIGASDAILARLADYYVPSSRIDEVVTAIAGLGAGESDKLSQLITGYAIATPPSMLKTHRALIDSCFRHDTVEQIVASLDYSATEFAKSLAATLRANSPTSLKVTLKLLRLARKSKTIEDCLQREYSAVMYAAACAKDLKEGIRAAIIDKDRKPRWSPANLEDVSDETVAAYLNHQPRYPIPFHN